MLCTMSCDSFHYLRFTVHLGFDFPFYLFIIYIICGEPREITSHRMRFYVEFTNKEVAEDLEAYLCILIALMFWRFNLTFSMTSSGLISLPGDRNFSLRKLEIISLFFKQTNIFCPYRYS